MFRMLNPPVYDLAVTEAISNVLARTDYPGLSGGELVAVLKHAKVFEFEDGPNKRTRLLHTRSVSTPPMADRRGPHPRGDRGPHGIGARPSCGLLANRRTATSC